ncbi:DUF6294 family protein [Bacillus sp. 3103sda1]|uniref:DUF6294 family protein n=1 Tax=Bacillus sp. 3103sda1 TaxID=2953808 RepID=UPI00209FF826|nr:DUF6294 family protein [Bacillus sp. 3103sda1]MCP1122931.1 DUF6294 family protein [Bacillus sp. 3103sda1]
MNELNIEEQINTDEKERAKNQTKKCSEVPPVNAVSSSLGDSLKVMELREKVLSWSGQVYHVGDCTIQNMRCSFWSDGKARFNADVMSSDSGDVWVFYGGMSIHDNHGVELWRSGKLIGPGMSRNQWTLWNQVFFFPAAWFDSIDSAICHQMHC